MKEEIERILLSMRPMADIEKATNKLLDLFYNELSTQDDEPYFGWCDVQGCGNEAAGGGVCWRDSGYWSVCMKHSNEFRSGKPHPPMKQSAIEKEKRRGADGILKPLTNSQDDK